MIRSTMRTRRRRTQSHPSVSLTPLIDTALTLLVVFMVTASAVRRSMRVDLPRGVADETMQQSPNAQAITVTVDDHETIFVDGERCDLDAAVAKIRAVAQRGKGEISVYLNVDRKASSGASIELLSRVRAVEGVQCIAFDVAGT